MAPTLVQAATEGGSGSGIGGNLTLPAPATALSLLLMVLGHRNSLGSGNTIPGWLRTYYNHSAPATLDSDSVSVWAKIAAGGEQVIAVPNFPPASDPASGCIAEFSGFGALAALESAGGDLAGAVATYPALAPSLPGVPAVLLRADWKKPAAPNPGPMTLAGWALLGDTGFAGAGNRHRLTIFYLAAAAASPNYPAAARSSSADGSDTGVRITAASLGVIPAHAFVGEPGGGVW